MEHGGADGQAADRKGPDQHGQPALCQPDRSHAVAPVHEVEGEAGGAGPPGAMWANAAAGLGVPDPPAGQALEARDLVSAPALAGWAVVELPGRAVGGRDPAGACAAEVLLHGDLGAESVPDPSGVGRLDGHDLERGISGARWEAGVRGEVART